MAASHAGNRAVLIFVAVAPCHLLLCLADLDAGSGHRRHGERLCHVTGAVCGATHAPRAVELAPRDAGKEVSNDAHEPQIQHRFVTLDQKLMPLTVLSTFCYNLLHEPSQHLLYLLSPFVRKCLFRGTDACVSGAGQCLCPAAQSRLSASARNPCQCCQCEALDV